MLNLESLLYGSKSLLIGLPVGVVLSYSIYWGMSATFQFAYKLPFTAIIISIAAVMLLTLVTMRYSKRMLREISIVEAIRNEAL
jgi:putative ABC transport system permease protein